MTTQPETPMVERVSRLEGAYDQVNERLGDLTQAMTSLHSEVHEVETRLSEKIDAQGREFRADIQVLNEKIDAQGREFRADIQVLNEKIDAQGEVLTAKIDAQGEALRSEMNSRFNTVYVLVGGVWATMVGGFIALFLAILARG